MKFVLVCMVLLLVYNDTFHFKNMRNETTLKIPINKTNINTIHNLDDNTLISSISGPGEHYWYHKNNLSDRDTTICSDKQHEDYVLGEKQFLSNIIKHNTKHQIKTPVENNTLDYLTQSSSMLDGFGQNRAPVYWNKTEYPIVTTNGYNMNDVFT